MKKIMTLAVIAFAAVAMVSCCGAAEKKCNEQAPQTAIENCDKNCAECEKAAEGPQATPAPAAEAPAETPAETPAK